MDEEIDSFKNEVQQLDYLIEAANQYSTGGDWQSYFSEEKQALMEPILERIVSLQKEAKETVTTARKNYVFEMNSLLKELSSTLETKSDKDSIELDTL